MNLRWHRWAPVLAAALGFAVLAWLIASATQSGHHLLSKGIPPGLPVEMLEYVPDDFVDEFPDGVDLAEDNAGRVPPDLMDRLGRELSPEELAALSRVLSDDVLLELAEQKAFQLSPEELQKIWDNLDYRTQQRLLDSVDGRFTQSQLDLYADKLSPELYEELSRRTRPEPDPDPTDTPTSDTGTTSEPEPSDSDSPTPSQAEPSSSSTDEAADEEDSDPLDWLNTLGELLLLVVKWLLILGVLALVGYMVYRVISALSGWRPQRRQRDRPVAEETAEAEEEPGPEVAALREAVADGLADLTDSTDPRRGVIACWQRLERAAAAAGVARLAAETPGELVTRVLTAAKVDPDTLTGLAETYRRARYGPHAIGEDLRQQAVSALAALDRQLADTGTKAATT